MCKISILLINVIILTNNVNIITFIYDIYNYWLGIFKINFKRFIDYLNREEETLTINYGHDCHLLTTFNILSHK